MATETESEQAGATNDELTPVNTTTTATSTEKSANQSDAGTGEPEEVKTNERTENKAPNRKTKEETANIVSILTFQWLSQMFVTGYKQALQLHDLDFLRDRDRSQALVEKFNAAWDQQVTRYRNKEIAAPSVPRALLRAFGAPFYVAIVLKLCQDVIVFANPTFLQFYLQAMYDDNRQFQYIWSGAMFGAAVLSSIVLQQYYHRTYTMGMRARGCLLPALFDKILRVNVGATPDQSPGKLMNVITTDTGKIQSLFGMVLAIVSAPLQIAIATFLLYQQIRWSVFVGIAFQMFVMTPILMYINTKARALQRELAKKRDARLSVVNEVFGAIKVIKMYAWEMSFGATMSDIRKDEISLLRSYSFLYALQTTMFMFASALISLVAFAVYTAAGNELDGIKIFTSLALFEILRFPVSMLPMVIAMVIEANISFRRVRDVLMSTELDTSQVQVLNSNSAENAKNYAIEIKDASFYFDEQLTEHALKHISCGFEVGSLTMIIGQTGSGKTSILRAILGDLNKSEHGALIYYDSTIYETEEQMATATATATKGYTLSFGYSSQTAWIQNSSVRDNIIFGKPFDAELYKKTTTACALKDDFQLFPNGDRTEIGEKGVNLSGGQKQRISLARAVYADADVYIFDDPLSAVDTHVATHIVESCLLKMLRHKTVILTTHAVTFLKHAQNILVMKDGEVQVQGTLAELQSANIDLAQFDIKKKKKKKKRRKQAEGGEGGEDGYDDDEIEYSMSSTAMSSTAMSSFSGTYAVSSFHEASLDSAKENKGTLVHSEERGVGSIGSSIYMLYVRAMGGVCWFVILLLFATVWVSTDSMSQFWLAIWAAEIEQPDARSSTFYLLIYIAFVMGATLILFFMGLIFLFGKTRASQKLHDSLLNSMLHGAMQFFDETPFGRIINRFAKDMNDVDSKLPSTFESTLRLSFTCVGALIRVVIASWAFIIGLIPLMIVYYFVQRYFVATLRELRRLSSIMNSPIYSHFNESMQGVTVIRALSKQESFQAHNRQLIDNDLSCYYPSISANRWLGVRLDFISAGLLGGAALACALTQPAPGVAGVALTSVSTVATALSMIIRQKAQLEQDIISVERINQYLGIQKEAAFEIAETKPEDSWPSKGSISVRNVWMKYRENLDHILRGLTFEVKGGEKVGVIGRTGAGKSSLFTVLLRLVEIDIDSSKGESYIEVDGVDISTIGLKDLRSKISVIPQEPILFAGTVKSNLDPFNERSDEELLQALKSSHIYDAVKKMAIESDMRHERKEAKEEKKHDDDGGDDAEDEQLVRIDISDAKYDAINVLQYEVEDNGSNFSLGQRQLLCMARAIVRKSKIILLDEATSSVDPQTDKLIQATVRETFTDNTILTIAHRIETVLDYDKILIMDQGSIAEYDSPENLLKDPESKFTEIVKSSFGVDVQKVYDEYVGAKK